MKTALITTTINVPRVLALYAKYGADVMFFIAGDRKTPDVEVVDFLIENDVPHHYYGIDWQHGLGYKCSTLLGENCIQRRNIALLEAVKWGAELIVSIDDDNIPLDRGYFIDFRRACSSSLFAGYATNFRTPVTFHGLKATSPTNWFDVGTLLQPKAPHRGFPYNKTAPPEFSSIVDAKIGVAAGICLGDPDISAVTRIANGPIVHNVSQLLQSGIVVDPKQTRTVFNSQNTAFIRQLAPAFFMSPGLGRYDDLFASLIMQRAMRQHDLHVHFGKPFVWQQRNPHDLVTDLEQEVWGERHIVEFSDFLDKNFVEKPSLIESLRQLYGSGPLGWPAPACALAFLDDMEKVL